ncbi:MAG: VacJ family lipoprotein [Desulfocapsaceae bacterium]|nr:VacJ family lipoprotein [Desulfocapsaceae bacterium]
MRQRLLMVLCLFCLVSPAVIMAADYETTYPDLLADEFADYEDTEVGKPTIHDPLEPMNRVFFEFNDKLYFYVLKPAKTGYSYVIPVEFRECFGNFFNNIKAPIRIINNLLQGRFEDAGISFSRFLINSTAGVLGFADTAASEYNLRPRMADFGQTLGYYGFGEGIYILWPVLGPSHIRSTFGYAGDVLASPSTYINMTTGERVVYSGTRTINTLSLRPGVYEEIKKFSLDPYVSARQSFYDFRRNMVERARSNGNEQNAINRTVEETLRP